MALRIQEVSAVAPPRSSLDSASPKSLPLTHFDTIWLNQPQTQRLFFYEIPHHVSFSDSMLPKLKHSLSLTLHHFLPLAGKLVWPPDSDEPFIRIDEDAAVTVTVADSDADFKYLAGDGFRVAADYDPLVPQLPRTETEASIIGLQITVFGTVGFTIGYTYYHAAGDGKTTTMFLKAWSHICRLGEGSSLPPELTPFFDRTVIEDPDDIKGKLLARRVKGPRGKTLMPFETKPLDGKSRATFVLTRANIEKLREKYTQASQRQNVEHMVPARISSFSIACGYTWACLGKSQVFEKSTAYFAFPANGRSLLNPPIPETYFGNCLSGCITKKEVDDLRSEDGYALAAAAINDSIRTMKENGISKKAEAWLNLGKIFLTEKVQSLAGSPQFGLYGTDFGWGRPKKTEVVSIDRTEAIGLSESRDGDGGIEIGLVLESERLEAFASEFAQGLVFPPLLSSS